MIVSGSEKVFPAEVENRLVEQPAVADAAVIGVREDDFGQRLKAFVVPRDVEFVGTLPRNATGKLLRGKLR